MSKPAWLQEVRHFCGGAGIEVAGWGADTLIVTAKTPERANQVASQLEPFGFKPVVYDDDAYAGLLTLSRDVAGTRDKIASFDVSRRPLNERLIPLIWCAIAVVFLFAHTLKPWLSLIEVVPLALLIFYGIRIWGWALEVLPEELRVRRDWRWSTIPWDQISAVETAPGFGRDQELVILKLVSGVRENLGSFWFAFARNLRDRLRYELAAKK